MRARLALLLLLSLPWPRPAWAAPPGALVLPPDAAQALSESLGYRDQPLHLGQQAWLLGIRVDQVSVELEVRGPEGAGATLIARRAGALPVTGEVLVARGNGVTLYAGRARGAWLAPAARALLPHLEGLPWVRADRAPLTSQERAAPSPWMMLGVSAGLWALLLAGLALLGRGLGALAPGERPWRHWWAAASLLALSLAARLAWSHPWPLNLVEVERGPFNVSPAFAPAAWLAAPFTLWAPDPLFVVGLAHLAWSSVAPLALATLASAWFGRRAGWFAGLALALSPAAVRFAQCSEPVVPLATLLVLGMLALELLARRPAPGTSLAAALLWSLLLHLRPEAPLLLLVPLAWWAGDARLRRALAPRELKLALGLPLAVSLVADLALSWLAPAAPLNRFPGWALTLESLGRWLASPQVHSPLLAALALLGAVSAGRARAAVLASLLLLIPLVDLGLGPVQPDDPDGLFRYQLFLEPAMALAAAGGLHWLAQRLKPRTLAAVTLALLGLAALAGPLFAWRYLSHPSPLQAEHRFLARVLPTLPEPAVLLVAANDRTGDDPTRQVTYRLQAASRLVLAGPPGPGGAPGTWVTTLEAWLASPPPEGVPLYFLSGWWEYYRAWHLHEGNVSTAPASPKPGAAPSRDAQAVRQRWHLETVACEDVQVAPVRGPGGERLQTCLYRLWPRSPG